MCWWPVWWQLWPSVVRSPTIVAFPAILDRDRFGEFVFGADDGPENERPRRLVDGQAFAINRTEITNRQYQRFVDATGHRSAFYGDHPLLGLDDRPVVGVSWRDADAFCRHYGLALPSEQEYERAARGTDGAPFPWGSAAPDLTTRTPAATSAALATTATATT